jgi:D-serine deaminase-like pyridoxal phosphate-dependent protein
MPRKTRVPPAVLARFYDGAHRVRGELLSEEGTLALPSRVFDILLTAPPADRAKAARQVELNYRPASIRKMIRNHTRDVSASVAAVRRIPRRLDQDVQARLIELGKDVSGELDGRRIATIIGRAGSRPGRVTFYGRDAGKSVGEPGDEEIARVLAAKGFIPVEAVDDEAEFRRARSRTFSMDERW